MEEGAPDLEIDMREDRDVVLEQKSLKEQGTEPQREGARTPPIFEQMETLKIPVFFVKLQPWKSLELTLFCSVTTSTTITLLNNLPQGNVIES